MAVPRDDESLDELARQAAELEALAKQLRAKLARRDDKASDTPRVDHTSASDEASAAAPAEGFSIEVSGSSPRSATKPAKSSAAREAPNLSIGTPERPPARPSASPASKPAVKVGDKPRGKSEPVKLDARGKPLIQVEEEVPPELPKTLGGKLKYWLLLLALYFGKGGLISLGVNSALIGSLALYHFSLPSKPRPNTLIASDTMAEEIAPVQELAKVETPVEVPKEETTPLDVPVPTPVEVPAASSIAPEVTGEMPVTVGTGLTNLGGVGDSDLLGDVPTAPPAKPAQPGKTSFFGTARAGNKFMFIIDNSGSMRGKPFDVARTELFKSISALKAPQKFYVIFYSGESYQMFSPDVATEMAEPNKENLEKLYHWLGNMQISSGGKGIYDAFRAAMKQQPDVIFLMGDGEMSDNAVDFILNLDTAGASINCVGFESQQGALNLKRIADKHKGAFQFIPAF